jgi:putative FmdB family regulatory protein
VIKMPIYEYQCESCGDVVEQWQRMSDPPLDKCESCGGKMHKLISQSSFHLKGSGWYVTDYGADKSGSSPANGKAGTGDKAKAGEPSGSMSKAQEKKNTE